MAGYSLAESRAKSALCCCTGLFAVILLLYIHSRTLQIVMKNKSILYQNVLCPIMCHFSQNTDKEYFSPYLTRKYNIVKSQEGKMDFHLY